MIYTALGEAVAFCAFFGEDISGAFGGLAPALKAQLNYQAAIYNSTGRWARDLTDRRYQYTTQDWTRDMASAIQSYITEAWLAGMAENGLTHEDMLPEWQAQIDAIIANEKVRLPDLAAWITMTVETVRPLEAAWPAIHARLDMWANRWLDTFNQARSATAEEGAKEEWVVGPTEHCPTCLALNGLVAYVWEWEESGFRPQSPPNPLLKCGGYRCQCERRPTTKRRSPKVLNTLLNIATSQNIR